MAEITKSVKKSSKDRNGENIDVHVTVEAIENGFLITKNKEWRDPKNGYQYETKKWYSKDDPFEINTEDKSLADLFE